jgi:hypothetical protein
MRIPEDLDGPENLYLYLKSLNEEQRMFFATANLSEHDSEVIARTKAEFIIKDQVTYPSFVQKLIAMATMPTVKNIEIETEKPGLNPNQLEEKLQAKLREYTEELGLQLISIMLIESESYDSGTNIYHFLAVFK